MTVGKASALALGFAGAFALGAWVGPDIRGASFSDNAVPVAIVSEPEAAAATPAPGAVTPASTDSPRSSASESRVLTISASNDSVQRHARDLLSYGTDVKAAATGFKNAEQFMTVAYAAKNTAIPFVLLKHRVLTEGKSLADAIRELKPGIDATLEANRARLEARSELSRLS